MKRPVEHKDLLGFHFLSNPAFFFDGERIVYHVSRPDLEKNGYGPSVRNTPRDMSLVVFALPQAGQAGSLPSRTTSSNSLSQELQTYSKMGMMSPCQTVSGVSPAKGSSSVTASKR